MTSIRKITIVSLLILSVVATGLSATGAQETAAEAPIPLKVFRGGVTIDWDSDPVILELNDRLGVDIEFVTCGWGEIGQVRNLFLASGDVVDIVHHMDTSPQWIDDEVILPLTDLINAADHPYLETVAKADTFAPMQVDGEVYFVPMISHGSDWAFGVRQDWMDDYGLSAPKNEEDLFQVFKTFRDNAAGSGVIGMQLEGAAQIRRAILPVLTAFGVPTSFYDVHKNFFIERGRLRPIATADETKAAIEFLNRLYNEGLVNRDFPQMSSFPLMHEKYFLAGQAGSGWFQNPAGQETRLREAAPDAIVGTIPPFSARGREFTKATGIVVNGWIAVMNGTESPEKAIEVLEYVNSEEGRRLLTAGIEGVHYTSFDGDGYFDRIQSGWEADYDGNTYPLYFYFGQGLMHGYVPVERYGTFEEAVQHVVLFDPLAYKGTSKGYKALIPMANEWAGAPNPFQFVNFPELNDLQTAVNEVIIVGWTKAISAAPGEFDAEWSEFLSEWDRVDGAQWVKAYQDYYDDNVR